MPIACEDEISLHHGGSIGSFTHLDRLSDAPDNG